MKHLESLQDAISYSNQIHSKYLSGKQGVNCYFSLRQSNGEKLIISITKGTKITEQTVRGQDGLIISHNLRSNSYGISMSHQIYLGGLRQINFYEGFAEYLTTNKIDFMYVVQNKLNFSLLSNVGIAPIPKMLAQWAYEDKQLNMNLEHLGKTVIQERKKKLLKLDLN